MKRETQRLAPEEARLRLRSDAEVALLDVREHGQYGEGHPFLAVNLPYSRLEIEAPLLLPSMNADLILLDDADGVAEKAAARLNTLGYRRISVIEGGAPGWAAAGLGLFKGVNVPSKAFGELIEHAHGTPSIDAHELNDWQKAHDAFVLVDGRSPIEYSKMTIPGAICCPNAELGYRLTALVSDDKTPIVVHCAGRTRSIIGAETLRALGIPNPVYALRNGTQGWRLAGFELKHGAIAQYPAVSGSAVDQSRDHARILRETYEIPTVKTIDLDSLRACKDRTVYVLDVRTEEEFREGHLPYARHAPGGQLVQAADQWIAVRGARIILVDDNGLRASVTAHWLRQMGHDAAVLDQNVTELCKTIGVEKGEPPPRFAPSLLEMPLSRLTAAISEGAVVLDLNPGRSYRAGHIAGTRWAIRPRLGNLGLNQSARVVLLSADLRPSELAAVDLREFGITDISHVPGTEADWLKQGVPISSSPDMPSDEECIDYLFFVHDRHDGNLAAARSYLDWEMNLTNQMDAEDLATFRLK